MEQRVTLHVNVDTGEVFDKTKQLIELLEKANSLVDELAVDLNNLEIEVKV